MKLTFLGGADEVGASCTVLELAGRRILVDCGIRMNPEDGDPLPYLSPIHDMGGIDAIVLTHAHMDHLGAMPTLVSSFPKVPVYMTPATLQLSTIMLADALKIMSMQFEEFGIPPIYSQPAVELLLAQARCVSFGQVLSLFDDTIRVQFNPAGHIIGAATVLFESEEGSALLTGDISVAHQITIPGVAVPQCKPNVVVVESTYGGRAHADRKGEERRLVERVDEVIREGGSVLFPAFAIGRAQEIILILSRAMERKRLKRVPIFVDGLVKKVCGVFNAHPHLLTPWLRKRVEKTTNPFFHEGSPAIPVWNYDEREKLLKLGQCIIVSSSGMLTGGPSQFYARHMAGDARNLIAITGYQDEESPGRKVQEIARKGKGSLKLGADFVELRCQVSTYSLSAHADTGEMVDVCAQLEADEIFLVHGDANARSALQEALEARGLGVVRQPSIGQSFEVRGHSGSRVLGKTTHTKRADVLRDTPERVALSADFLPGLARELVVRDGPTAVYTAQEIIWAWGDLSGGLKAARLHEVAALLDDPASPFVRDRSRPYLYRVARRTWPRSVRHPRARSAVHTVERSSFFDPEATTPPPKIITGRDRHEALQRVLEAVDIAFMHDPTYLGRKANPSAESVEVAFHFPNKATKDHTARLEELSKETGWTFSIRQTPHNASVTQAALDVIPDTWHITGTVSHLIHDPTRDVRLTLAHTAPRAEIDRACAAFHERTHMVLEIVEPGITPPTPPLTAGPTTQAKPTAERMEINRAYQTIRDRFATRPHQPLKIGKKGTDAILLRFISPAIGAHYTDDFTALSQETGWALKLHPHPDQIRIIETISRAIPQGFEILKGPSLHIAEHRAVCVLNAELPPKDQQRIQHEVKQACGFALTLDVRN